MSKTRMNVVYGEKYGDPNDPKTRWLRVGSLLTDDETGRMSIKIDTMPVSKHFDGWLSVFEVRDDEGGHAPSSEWDKAKPAPAAATKAKADDTTIQDLGNGPINLEDIPFSDDQSKSEKAAAKPKEAE